MEFSAFHWKAMTRLQNGRRRLPNLVIRKCPFPVKSLIGRRSYAILRPLKIEGPTTRPRSTDPEPPLSSLSVFCYNCSFLSGDYKWHESVMCAVKGRVLEIGSVMLITSAGGDGMSTCNGCEQW